MQRQMTLPLDVDGQRQLRRLWKQLPEQSRIELVAQYARLIARAARDATSSQEQETRHEASDR